MLYVLGNGMLLLFVLVELIISRLVEKNKFDFKEVVFNINSGHIMLWVIRSVELGIYHLACTYLSFNLISQLPTIAVWIFAFIAWDLSFYWYHRIHHKYSWLWYIHVVHHEGEEFNLSLGIRNSWYSALTTIPFFLWLALVGVPFQVFAVVSIIHYFIQFLNHNSFINDIGIFDKIFVSPSHHKVHHGKQDIYHNTNFGGTFVWWDLLFNTYQKEEAHTPVKVGIAKPFKSQNIFEANNNRILKALNIKLKKPKRSYFTIPGWFLLLTTCFTFCGFLMYVRFEEIISFNTKSLLFLVIFIAINAIGGLSEGRRWGMILWSLNSLVLAPFLLYEMYGFSNYFNFILLVLIVITLMLLTFVLRSYKTLVSS